MNVLGPDHMAIYFKTAKDVDFVGSSVGYFQPTYGSTYFLYYSHGTRTEPWYLTLEVQVS